MLAIVKYPNNKKKKQKWNVTWYSFVGNTCNGVSNLVFCFSALQLLFLNNCNCTAWYTWQVIMRALQQWNYSTEVTMSARRQSRIIPRLPRWRTASFRYFCTSSACFVIFCLSNENCQVLAKWTPCSPTSSRTTRWRLLFQHCRLKSFSNHVDSYEIQVRHTPCSAVTYYVFTSQAINSPVVYYLMSIRVHDFGSSCETLLVNFSNHSLCKYNTSMLWMMFVS